MRSCAHQPQQLPPLPGGLSLTEPNSGLSGHPQAGGTEQGSREQHPQIAGIAHPAPRQPSSGCCVARIWPGKSRMGGKERGRRGSGAAPGKPKALLAVPTKVTRARVGSSDPWVSHAERGEAKAKGVQGRGVRPHRALRLVSRGKVRRSLSRSMQRSAHLLSLSPVLSWFAVVVVACAV